MLIFFWFQPGGTPPTPTAEGFWLIRARRRNRR
jgi:hypothetical protein